MYKRLLPVFTVSIWVCLFFATSFNIALGKAANSYNVLVPPPPPAPVFDTAFFTPTNSCNGSIVFGSITALSTGGNGPVTYHLSGTSVPVLSDVLTVIITGTDAGQNTSVCRFDVPVRCSQDLDIPQFISPNRDGQNDTWEIPGLAQYPENVVKVFNRWGP